MGTDTDMVRRYLLFLSIPLFASAPCLAADEKYLIYSPKSANQESAAAKSADELLVREILIEKGDTLYGLSRRFNGAGTYYPQILLFNNIKNPSLIYAGKKLKIPLMQGVISSSLPVHKGKKMEEPLKPGQLESHVPAEPQLKVETPAPARNNAVPVPVLAPIKPENPAEQAVAQVNEEQKLFVEGLTAYKDGKCASAVTLLDRFISRYPDSTLAADAALYRADCYLTLSAD